MFNAVKDSGARENFDTGSRRDTRDGKGRFDLIPHEFLEALARHFENGARKYGDRNWEKGQPLSRYLDSALRHMMKARQGLEDEDHLSAAAWNICGILCTLAWARDGKLPRDLVDLPYSMPEVYDPAERALRNMPLAVPPAYANALATDLMKWSKAEAGDVVKVELPPPAVSTFSVQLPQGGSAASAPAPASAAPMEMSQAADDGCTCISCKIARGET